MARYGFSGGVTELKIVLLYTLRRTLWQPTREELTELAFIDENMDYFQFCEALTSLIQNGQITLSAGQRHAITEEGAQNAEIMEHELPGALRRAIDEHIEPHNEIARREACLHTEILTRRGETYALCTLSDGTRPVLKLELLTGGQQQAEALCVRFKANAEAVYQQVMHMLD